MKIALCSDYFYPIINGVTKHIEQLANNLEKNGHEVVIITKKSKYDDSKHGLTVKRVSSYFNTNKTLDIPYSYEFEQVIRQIKPDIIHAHHCFSPLSISAIAIGNRLGIKTVLTNHTIQFLYDYDYIWKPSSYVLFPYRKYIKKADTIIAVSKAAKEFIAHFTKHKIKIVPNAINVADFSTKNKEFDGQTILFVGRFVYRKGFHILLESMRQVVKKNKNAKLIIVGSGYMKPVIKLLISTLELKNNIIIKENITDKEKIKLYQEANVFVAPSIFGESFGIVLLEAMAAKTPIIATNHGGMKEVITNNKTGILIDKRAAALTTEILKLLQNKSLSKKISSRAYKEVKKYDWKRVTKQMEKLYKQTLKSK